MPTIRPPSPLALMRLRAGLTQERVAAALKVSRPMVSWMETGEREVGRHAAALAELYGVRRSELETAAGKTVREKR